MSTWVSLLFLVACLLLRKEWGRGDPFFFVKVESDLAPKVTEKSPFGCHWGDEGWHLIKEINLVAFLLMLSPLVAAWGFGEQQTGGMGNGLCGLLVCTGQMVCFLHFGVVCYVVCDRLRLFGPFYMGKLRLRLSDLPKLPQQIGSGLRFLDSLFTLLSKCYRHPLVSSQPASHFWE